MEIPLIGTVGAAMARAVVLVAVGLVPISLLANPVAAQQQPSPSFAAGGLNDWGASVSGSRAPHAASPGAASPAPTTKSAPAAPRAAAKPKAGSAKLATRKANAKKPVAVDAAETGDEIKALSGAKFTPAGAMHRGPIIVRPPDAHAATAQRGAPPALAPVAMTPPQASTLAPGDCLAVHQIGPGTYQIENAGCANASVLATIEIRNDSRSVTCYIARIRDAYAVTSPPGAPPRINHQCRDGAPGCTELLLKGMFPECRGSV